MQLVEEGNSSLQKPDKPKIRILIIRIIKKESIVVVAVLCRNVHTLQLTFKPNRRKKQEIYKQMANILEILGLKYKTSGLIL